MQTQGHDLVSTLDERTSNIRATIENVLVLPLSRHPSPRSVLIIGCGIVGAATAFFLARRGVDVTIIEREGPASAATGAADGAVSVASKRPGPMMVAALSGVALYRELLGDGTLTDLFKPRSTFVVAASDAECAVLEAHAGALRGEGVAVEMLAHETLIARFPALSSNVRMGAEVKGDGHAIGYRIVNRLLSLSGVTVLRGVEAYHLVEAADGRIVAVATSRGELSADAVVIAAGNGAPTLLNCDGVMKPRKGQLLVTERAPALNASMPGSIMSGRYLLSKGSQKGAEVSARGYGLVVDPLVTGQFLIGGTREDSDARQTNDLEAVRHILTDAVAMVPGLADIRLLRAFAGVRTAVIDGLPLVGRLPGRNNLFVAAGFEGDGICLGPVMGQAIAAMACGETPSLDLSSFDPARFTSLEVAA
ncbi:MAG: FAD-binding oxidoreductase [Proteobacteria bacterium]|nr:FAD-binding oxidoreductase [Pseudomonadota bacterium]